MAFAKRKFELNKNGKTKHAPRQRKTNVLYQRLGDQWFAFTMIDDDILYGVVPEKAFEGTENAPTDSER